MYSEMFDASSYSFSWFAVPVILAGVLNWLLGLATFIRERGSPTSRTLLAMTFVIGVWLIGLGVANATVETDAAAPWIKLSAVGTMFVPLCVFTHAALGTSKLRLMAAFVGMGLCLSVTLTVLSFSTEWIFGDVREYFWGYYPVYGPLGFVVMVYYGFSFVAGGLLYRLGHGTTKSTTERTRLRLRLAALAVAIPATVDFLPTMHVGVYPFGYVFILAYIAISTFSIWRYRLVDITPALAAKQVMDTMAEGLLVVDRDGIVRVANEAAEAVWGTRGLVGGSCAALDDQWGQPALVLLLDPDVQRTTEVTYSAPDGASQTAAVAASKLIDRRGAWVGTVYVLHDLTQRTRAEAALRQSEERFRSLVQNASDLITVIDPDTTVRYQSPAIEHVLGFESGATLGAKLADVVHPDDTNRFLASLGDLMTKPAGTITGDGRVRDSQGEWRHLEFTGSDQRRNPAIGGLVLNVRDVTERKRLEEQLLDQALHDPLTKLANRTRFADRLDHALARRSRARGDVAVLFMDLDNFKGINDGLGHAAGDLLLRQVAERITRCMRPADTVARLGGDEFALLLEDIASIADATTVADRLFEELEAPFLLEGKHVAVRVSAGIATTIADSTAQADELLRDADIAMYVAKSRGKGCYRVFEASMRTSMLGRLELLAELPQGLERDEFVLQYQPIFLLKGSKLFGVEALVRWQHPTRGLVPPAEFVPLAEESGAILPLGRWVLREACRQAAAWNRMFPANDSWTMSVNVSVKQLEQASFPPEVAAILAETGFEPRRLILEITETAMMHDLDLMLERLRELKALGIGLAIDDFGTGYSSLNYLRQFPFDLLKIDKSFIDDLGMIVNQKELTRAIIELGKSLDLELVAEGIERSEQLSRLQSMECEMGQGFLFAKPLESSDVEDLLRTIEAETEAA